MCCFSARALLLLLLLAAPALADDGEVARRARVDAAVAAAVATHGPGAAVAVIGSAGVLHVSCHGLADIASGRAIDARTIFDLASVSKQFVATAALRLAERGELDLERDVRELIPELGPRPEGHRVLRVRDLIHQTSGLPDYTGWLEELDDPGRDCSAAWVAERVAKEELGPPGQGWAYSNTNYALLGLVLERTAKVSLEALLERELFEPLGLSRTRFLARPDQEIPDRATGYAKRGRRRWTETRFDVPGTGDGNVFSCLEEMVAWERAQRGGGALSDALLARSRERGRLDDGTLTGYAAGWLVDGDWVGHGGGWAGTSTMISRRLDTGISVIVLRNLDGAGAEELAEAVLRAWTGEESR